MSVRGELCFRISKALTKPPPATATDPDRYSEWRFDEVARSWSHFSNASVDGKDVLDFGCGEGPLSLYLAETAKPRSIIGVDLLARSIERANTAVARQDPRSLACKPDFRLGGADRLPIDDSSVDTILVFDCMEHIMDPEAIMAEWRRVLRPDGRVLIEWTPFKGPWGSHMNSIIPIPWAHVLFGERALFEAAERLYDDPDYVPRRWDYDEQGKRRPNRLRSLRRFRDAGYLNEIDIAAFRRIAAGAGFTIERLESKPLAAHGAFAKRMVGKLLLALPVIGEYATGFIIAELRNR